jgi:hypothetical protein
MTFITEEGRFPQNTTLYRVNQVADDTADAWRAHQGANLTALNEGIERVFEAKHDAPVPEVVEALREMFAGVGMTPDDDFLLSYAEVISEGRPVKFELG